MEKFNHVVVFNHTVLDAIDSQSCSLILSRNNKMKIIKVCQWLKPRISKNIISALDDMNIF